MVTLAVTQGPATRTALLEGPEGLERPAGPAPTRVTTVRELVRVNHLRNCMLCHAPSIDPDDPVPGRVPTPGQPVPPPFSGAYYESRNGTFVRADITYLRQDFSVPQPVARHGNWPAHQRYDYLVRTRYATAAEQAAAKDEPATFPQRDAARWALRELTGKEGEQARR
jgi:hypothetical protein